MMRVLVTGKGGVGKTTLTALLAQACANAGFQVLAVDGDPQQNLAVTLGVPPSEAEQIVPLSHQVRYIGEKTGAVPGSGSGGLLVLNPDVTGVAGQFSVPLGERIRLLVLGGVSRAGGGCLCPEFTLLSSVIRGLPGSPDDMVLLDTQAGLEHFGRAVASGYSTALVVADPSYNALSVAATSARLARQLGVPDVVLVVNQVHSDAHKQTVTDRFRDLKLFSGVQFLPYEPAVRKSEPAVDLVVLQGTTFLDHLNRLVTMITRTGFGHS
jgi:CO dehydrogenase maturation factor